jgi:hypothetical protein
VGEPILKVVDKERPSERFLWQLESVALPGTTGILSIQAKA